MAGISAPDPDSTTFPETLPTNTPDQFSFRKATFDEVLEELSSRFILNLPEDELAEVERVCFQVEQAHWYYEDFIREENPSLPSFSLKKFSEILFRSCPLLHHWSHDHEAAFNDFMEYKTRVPVCGAIMLNESLTKCVLVKGWKASAGWSFPRGKVNENEDEALCAAREVLEETGYNLNGQIQRQYCVRLNVKQQPVTLFVVPGIPESFAFQTQTRKEISKIDWFKLSELPGWKKTQTVSNHKFYLIQPVIPQLKNMVKSLRKARKAERSPPKSHEVNGTSPYPSVPDARDLDQAKLSNESLIITGPSFQTGSGEAELSSSQSSSVDPHTPSVNSDLSPHTFGNNFVKTIFTVEDGISLQDEVPLDRPSPVNADAHWMKLMTKLTDSESLSLGTPQAVTPTPVNSDPGSDSDPVMMNGSSSSSQAPSVTPSSGTLHPGSTTVAEPAVPVVNDIVKRTRQLQLLDSVLAEESAKAPQMPQVPQSAHVMGSFHPEASVRGMPSPYPSLYPSPYPVRSVSVHPAVQASQYTNLPFLPHPPPPAAPHIPFISHHSNPNVLPPPPPPPSRPILPQQQFIRSPGPIHPAMNGSNGPIPRPSTVLSSQMSMASNLPKNLAHLGGAAIDPGHRGQMLALLSGSSPLPGARTAAADYMGHRGFSSTSSLSTPMRRNGNARLLSLLNEGRGPVTR